VHVLTVKVKQVKSEIGEVSASAVGDPLHDLERGHAIGADAAQLSVDIGCVDVELREGGRSDRVFFRPIKAGPGKKIHMAFLNPRPHAVTVELDLVNPLRASRRFGGQLRELRFDPAGEWHVGSSSGVLSSSIWTASTGSFH